MGIVWRIKKKKNAAFKTWRWWQGKTWVAWRVVISPFIRESVKIPRREHVGSWLRWARAVLTSLWERKRNLGNSRRKHNEATNWDQGTRSDSHLSLNIRSIGKLLSLFFSSGWESWIGAWQLPCYIGLRRMNTSLLSPARGIRRSLQHLQPPIRACLWCLLRNFSTPKNGCSPRGRRERSLALFHFMCPDRKSLSHNHRRGCRTGAATLYSSVFKKAHLEFIAMAAFLSTTIINNSNKNSDKANVHCPNIVPHFIFAAILWGW